MSIVQIYFISDFYKDKYYSLIQEARYKHFSGYVEKHHIIPKVFFQLENQMIDNSSQNLIELSTYYHILAHYYLALGTTGQQQVKMLHAFNLMTTSDRILTLSELEYLTLLDLENFALLREQSAKSISKIPYTLERRQKISKSNKNKPSFNDALTLYNEEGQRKYIFLDELLTCPESWYFAQDPTPEHKNTEILKKAYLNILEKATLQNIKIQTKQDYYQVFLSKQKITPKKSTFKWINNSLINIKIKDTWPIPDNWTLGKLKNSNTRSKSLPPNHSGHIWISNGIEQKRVAPDFSLPEGWYYGQNKAQQLNGQKTGGLAAKDTIWINNGLINKRLSNYLSIPEGFKPGFLGKKKK